MIDRKKLIKMEIWRLLKKGFLVVSLIAVGVGTQTVLPSVFMPQKDHSSSGKSSVLSASSKEIPGLTEIGYSVPVTFDKDAVFNGKVIIDGKPVQLAPIQSGSGQTLSLAPVLPVAGLAPSSPGLTGVQSGVLSLQGQTGDLNLTAGNGIGISNLTITNTDGGSGQNIFKTVSVPGVGSVSAGSNSDTFLLSVGDGLVASVDQSTKKITVSQNIAQGMSANGLIYATAFF